MSFGSLSKNLDMQSIILTCNNNIIYIVLIAYKLSYSFFFNMYIPAHHNYINEFCA